METTGHSIIEVVVFLVSCLDFKASTNQSCTKSARLMHLILQNQVFSPIPLLCWSSQTKFTCILNAGTRSFHYSTAVLSRNVQIRDTLSPDLPKHHSRAMKREFIYSFGTITNCKPAFLRKAYQVLTGDSTSACTLAEKEIDPELISDLWFNN